MVSRVSIPHLESFVFSFGLIGPSLRRIIITLAILGTALAPGSANAMDFIRGDVDQNGYTDITDALNHLGCLCLGTHCSTCDKATDVTDDGNSDITDAIELLGSLFLGTFTIPPPHPNCGADPTPDPLTCSSFDPAICPPLNPTSTNIAQDTELDTLLVPAGDTCSVLFSSQITIKGNAEIHGTLRAEDGALRLTVRGNCTITGALESLHSTPPSVPGNAQFVDLVSGIYLVVEGDLIFEATANVRANGPVVVTDNDTTLESTSQEVVDAMADTTDTRPSIVPLQVLPTTLPLAKTLPGSPRVVKGPALPPHRDAREIRLLAIPGGCSDHCIRVRGFA